MDDKKKDIQEVMREEGRRGRRPIDLASFKERQEKLASLRKLLEIATEEEFIEAIRAFGLREGSREFLASLEAWRGYRS